MLAAKHVQQLDAGINIDSTTLCRFSTLADPHWKLASEQGVLPCEQVRTLEA